MRGSTLRLGTQVTGRRREGLWPEARGQVSLCTKSDWLFCFLKNPLLLVSFFHSLSLRRRSGRWVGSRSVDHGHCLKPIGAFSQIKFPPAPSGSW